MTFHPPDMAQARPLRIIVVDDDAIIATLLAAMLEDIGHVVCGIEATEDGAVAAASREKPDLMIVDAFLREESGLSAMEKVLRERFVPFILMSGSRLSKSRLPNVTLQKPFMYGELVEAIGRATAVSRPRPDCLVFNPPG
jgi:DNA-binding NtrC family response regulator